jgi:threonine/homoserine/homoserine lactone efflux protein
MLDLAYNDAIVLAAISGLWLAALISPGPDFLLVTRVSITRGRAVAMRTVLGVAVGIALWAVAGFFGIHALFVASPWLYLALKIGGGAYLTVLGLRLLLGSWKPAAPEAHGAAAAGLTQRPFSLGFVTNLANPKAPIFVSSLFAATLPQHPPTGLGIAAIALMFALTLGWYALVARCLTIRPVAEAFAKMRRWIDRVAGIAFMGFGTRLMLDRSS